MPSWLRKKKKSKTSSKSNSPSSDTPKRAFSTAASASASPSIGKRSFAARTTDPHVTESVKSGDSSPISDMPIIPEPANTSDHIGKNVRQTSDTYKTDAGAFSISSGMMETYDTSSDEEGGEDPTNNHSEHTLLTPTMSNDSIKITPPNKVDILAPPPFISQPTQPQNVQEIKENQEIKEPSITAPTPTRPQEQSSLLTNGTHSSNNEHPPSLISDNTPTLKPDLPERTSDSSVSPHSTPSTEETPSRSSSRSSKLSFIGTLTGTSKRVSFDSNRSQPKSGAASPIKSTTTSPSKDIHTTKPVLPESLSSLGFAGIMNMSMTNVMANIKPLGKQPSSESAGIESQPTPKDPKPEPEDELDPIMVAFQQLQDSMKIVKDYHSRDTEDRRKWDNIASDLNTVKKDFEIESTLLQKLSAFSLEVATLVENYLDADEDDLYC